VVLRANFRDQMDVGPADKPDRRDRHGEFLGCRLHELHRLGVADDAAREPMVISAA